MLILAIDSSTPVASVALANSTGIVAEYFLNTGYTHSEKLMPMIDNMMKEARVGIEQLEGIVVAKGPGSFTGLRIGMATAKTIAQVRHIPILGINTLEGLAYNCLPFSGIICPLLNARKQEVYTALFESDSKKLKQIGEYTALSPKDLAEKINSFAKPVMLVGDGVLEYQSFWQEELKGNYFFAPSSLLLPRSTSIGLLGRVRILKGEADDFINLKPFYLRKSEAETRLAQCN